MPVDYYIDGRNQVRGLHLAEDKLLVRATVIVVGDDGSRILLLAARHIEDLAGMRHAVDAISHHERKLRGLRLIGKLTDNYRLCWP